MAAKIKKGDRVIVTTGRDKGKKGEVLKVFPAENRVLIAGINMVKRHQSQTARQQGGIINKESPIHMSNVAHVDPSGGKATKVGFKIVGDQKVRFARKSGEVLDV